MQGTEPISLNVVRARNGWEVHLGRIGTAQHRIVSTLADKRPIHYEPYQAGPKACKFEKSETAKDASAGGHQTGSSKSRTAECPRSRPISTVGSNFRELQEAQCSFSALLVPYHTYGRRHRLIGGHEYLLYIGRQQQLLAHRGCQGGQ